MATQFTIENDDDLIGPPSSADSDSDSGDFCYNFSKTYQDQSPLAGNHINQNQTDENNQGELSSSEPSHRFRQHNLNNNYTTNSFDLLEFNGVGSPTNQLAQSPTKSETANAMIKQQHRQRTKSVSKIAGQSMDHSVMHTKQKTIFMAGRPPCHEFVKPFVIGICGGSASGKTTVAKKIIEELDVPWVTMLSMDSFYKVLGEDAHKRAMNNEYNFDHPDAFDFDLLNDTLKRLKQGKRVEVPCYNFVTHSREKRTKIMYGANVIICDGILLFTNSELMNMMEMKIFIDTDSDVRLSRRLRRDITERGRDLEGVLKQYNKFVKPAFDHYIEPSMIHADLIVPRGGANTVAINLVVRHVQTLLQSRGLLEVLDD